MILAIVCHSPSATGITSGNNSAANLNFTVLCDMLYRLSEAGNTGRCGLFVRTVLPYILYSYLSWMVHRMVKFRLVFLYLAWNLKGGEVL